MIGKIENCLIKILAVSLSLFALYTALFGVFPASIQRTVHLMLTVMLGLLLPGAAGTKEMGANKRLINLVCLVLSFVVFGYFVKRQDILSNWIPFVSQFGQGDFIICVIATSLLLVVGRRFTGNALPIIAVIFMIYGRWGSFLPGFLQHANFSWERVMEIFFFGFDGVFGIPIGISATIISVFIMFGCFFELSGGGEALMDIGKYIAGQTRGGPAKIAVIGSALMGTISGSAVANVYATGTFSIPMMKKLGFKHEFAGAVEACASTGGQLVPPVMGAAAFVMADYTGLPYARICLAALIPAFLYYLSLFISVDIEAATTGIKGLPREDLPNRKTVLRQLPLLAPVIVIILMLTIGYSPMLAGVYSIATSIIVSYFTPYKLTPKRIFEALVLSGKRMIMIAVSTAMSGMIIGIIVYTSLGMNFLALVSSLPPSMIWIAPIFVAAASIILGMGVPTTVAYIIVSAVAVPALKIVGFGVIESHMFAFYFAVLSMITPPVAPASLAASEIAGASFFKTGMTACRVGLVTFIIPFVFLYNPELLFVGERITVVIATITASLGVFTFTAGVRGWFVITLRFYEQILLCVVGLLLIKPGITSDLAGISLLIIASTSIFIRYRKSTIKF